MIVPDLAGHGTPRASVHAAEEDATTWDVFRRIRESKSTSVYLNTAGSLLVCFAIAFLVLSCVNSIRRSWNSVRRLASNGDVSCTQVGFLVACEMQSPND